MVIYHGRIRKKSPKKAHPSKQPVLNGWKWCFTPHFSSFLIWRSHPTETGKIGCLDLFRVPGVSNPQSGASKRWNGHLFSNRFFHPPQRTAKMQQRNSEPRRGGPEPPGRLNVPLLHGVYYGYNPLTNHLLTSWDVQVGGSLVFTFFPINVDGWWLGGWFIFFFNEQKHVLGRWTYC